MKIEAGKYYRTRGGQVFGPMVRDEDYNANFPWCLVFSEPENCWAENGRWHLNGECPFDLVAEVYISDTPPDAKRETEAELREMMRDPRYWQKREPEWVKRVTEGFRALVGGDTPPADALPSDGAVNFENCTVGTYTPAPETKTLRDEFAGLALIGLLAAGENCAQVYNRDEIAIEAWRQADAMMEARKK